MNATQAYHDLINRVRTEGDLSDNRTGVNTVRVIGEMIKVDTRKGAPIITSKLTRYKAAINETAGFFRGITSAAGFRDLNVNVWNKNANEHGVKPNAWLSNPFREGLDHLGAIYGDQWRNWPGYKVIKSDTSTPEGQERHVAIITKLLNEGWTFIGDTLDEDGQPKHEIYYKAIDQVRHCVNTIINNPGDRRIIFHAWNPAMLDQMALPPCHLLYQFFPNAQTKRMDMVLYIRSNDLTLGLPFNMIGAFSVLAMMAKVTGYQTGFISFFIGDAHVYSNQNDYLDEQLTKEPYPQPAWHYGPEVPGEDVFGPSNPNWVDDAVTYLSKFNAHDIVIENYQYHTLTTPVPEMVV